MNLEERILDYTRAKIITQEEVIQELWSGYGEIVRLKLDGGDVESVIVKKIEPPESNARHPRGWNTTRSFQRKIKSYEIEQHWYESYTDRIPRSIRIPQLFFTFNSKSASYIVMEDLKASGYSRKVEQGSISIAKLCVKWLARFHANFLLVAPNKLWDVGTYWHLATRPDEWGSMNDSEMKTMAAAIDERLNQCKYQTIVHGDAKLANFCFEEDLTGVAAVDFQYVGGGCGMKDLAYFLGSCLKIEDLELWEEDLLDLYFEEFNQFKIQQDLDFEMTEVEKEWREMYNLAWADFSRFLLGWMPNHQKINTFSRKKVKAGLDLFKK